MRLVNRQFRCLMDQLNGPQDFRHAYAQHTGRRSVCRPSLGLLRMSAYSLKSCKADIYDAQTVMALAYRFEKGGLTEPVLPTSGNRTRCRKRLRFPQSKTVHRPRVRLCATAPSTRSRCSASVAGKTLVPGCIDFAATDGTATCRGEMASWQARPPDRLKQNIVCTVLHSKPHKDAFDINDD